MMILFPPACVLSAVSPVVAKLRLHDLEHTGRVVGSLSAWATAGALVGTFGTGFVLVPLMPTSAAVFAIGGLLLAVALLVAVRFGVGSREIAADCVLRRGHARRDGVRDRLAVRHRERLPLRGDRRRPRAVRRAHADPRRPAPLLRRPRRPRPPRVRLHALDGRRDRRPAARPARRRLPRRGRLHAAALRRRPCGPARARASWRSTASSWSWHGGGWDCGRAARCGSASATRG